MASSLNSTGITFSDSTTQSTAATAAALVTTTNVLNATAGASVGAVGTYAGLSANTGSILSPGDTLGGGSLRYSAFNGGNGGTGPSGTWRLMGYAAEGTYSAQAASVWLRIS